MSKKCFNAAELSQPVAYSHAVRAGDTIYIGGLISRDMDNNVVEWVTSPPRLNRFTGVWKLC